MVPVLVIELVLPKKPAQGGLLVYIALAPSIMTITAVTRDSVRAFPLMAAPVLGGVLKTRRKALRAPDNMLHPAMNRISAKNIVNILVTPD